MTQGKTIVLLCSDGHSTRAIANALTKEFGPIKVVMEQPVTRWQMAKRRARKIGVPRVAGQIAFVAAILPVLNRTGRKRIEEIETLHNLRSDWPEIDISNVDSVNSDVTRTLLQNLRPDLVIVNGTRIISQKTLDCVDSTFINTHAGITPLYRGVHGGYWALVEDKPQLVGTTVHLVDKGIDTGNVIEQAYFQITESDNFATYPYLHTAYGIPILIDAVKTFFEGRLDVKTEGNGLGSKLRHHPTIWGYLFHRIRNGVR